MKQMPLLDLCFCPISPFPRQVRDRDVIKAFIKIVLLLLFLQNQMSAQVDWSLTANFTSTENGKTGLADPLVRDIQADGKGRMWFATQRGVSCFDGLVFKNYLNTAADSMLWKNEGRSFLAADGAGRIWAVAATYRLFYFDENADRFVEYDLSGIEPEAEKNTWHCEIFLKDFTEKGDVLFRKNQGLYAIDAKTLAIRKVMHLQSEWRGVFGVLGKDNDGLIWMGGWEYTKSLVLLRPDGSIQRQIYNPMRHITLMYHQPGSNTVWLAANNFSSYDKSTGRWQQYNQTDATISSLVVAPALTGDSILWMHAFGAAEVLGFNIRTKKFQFQISTSNRPINALRCNNLYRIVPDSRGNLWFGGRQGVSVIFRDRVEMTKWTRIFGNAPPPADKSRTVGLRGFWKMPDGSLGEWLCNGEEQYYVALSKTTKAYFEGKLRDDGSIAGQRIFVDFKTGQRSVTHMVYRQNEAGEWIENEAGKPANPLPCKPVSVFGNRIVVCGGKYFDPKTDKTGTWKGSDGTYVLYFQDGDFVTFTLAEHFNRSKKISANEWVVKTVRTINGCRTFLISGIRWPLPDSMVWHWTANDGHCDLKKGQQGGGYSIRVKASEPNDSVFITDFRIFDKIQDIAFADFRQKEFVIEHDQNFISFDFTSSFDPAVTTFWHKLEGFDREWVQTRTQRTATYTNLDGGSYTFHVRAEDPEGTALVNKSEFRLRVKPPYYLSWWFITLSLLTLGTAIWLLFRYQLHQQLEKERLRLRIARDLHDEVGSTLGAISILSQSSRHGSEQDLDKSRLGNIGDKARTALDSIGDIVWSVNPENDSMEKVLARMRAYGSEMLENAGVDFRFEITTGVESLRLPMEKRKDFYLIYKEAIHNCAKYARARCLYVRLRKENNALILLVQDDGVGFDLTKQSAAGAHNLGGNGLGNMQSRAATIGGRLTVTAAPGAGTMILLELPLS